MLKFFYLLTLAVVVLAESSGSTVNGVYDKVEAEDFNEVAGGVRLFADCTYAGVSFNGQSGAADNYASYPGLDFEDGTQLVTVRFYAYFTNYTVGFIHFRLGSADAEPVASVTVTTTGAPCTFMAINNFLLERVVGVQNLFLTFDANDSGQIEVDWFHFTKTYV